MGSYHWWYEVIVALDRLLAAIILRTWSDETISSWCWRQHAEGRKEWPRHLVDTVMHSAFGSVDHCHLAWITERWRDANPPETRGRA